MEYSSKENVASEIHPKGKALCNLYYVLQLIMVLLFSVRVINNDFFILEIRNSILIIIYYI